MDDLVKAVLGDPLENCQRDCLELQKENVNLRGEITELKWTISILIDCVEKGKLVQILTELETYRRNDNSKREGRFY